MIFKTRRSARSTAAVLFVVLAACSKSPRQETHPLIVISDPRSAHSDQSVSAASAGVQLPQQASVLEDYEERAEAPPPSDDARQELLSASVRDKDPYRVSDSIIADVTS